MRRGTFIGLAMAGMVISGGTAWSQTIPERLGALERKVEAQQKDLAGVLGVEIHGLVALDYMYDINDPDSHEAQLRVFDTDANSFTLNQANLRFSRSREDEDFGFAVSMDFGKTAEVVGRATCWDHGCDSAENDNSFELREAYLTYKAPIGDGVTFKAGKFVTLHGAEVIKDYNALNYSISNSFLFGYAIPFTHTGIMASFPLGPYLSVDLGVVNGWDDVVDNNDGKSVHANFKITPVDTFSIAVSGTYGPEQPDNGKSKRSLVSTLLTFNPREELTFMVDADWGNESDLLSHRQPGPGLRDAYWYGFAGYVIVRPIERLSLALRAEVFDDADGTRTGIDVAGLAPGVTVWELTPSVSYQLTKGLLARFEYRHDEADRSVFDAGDHAQNGQDTLAGEMIYAF